MVVDRRVRAGMTTAAGAITGVDVVLGVLLLAGMRWQTQGERIDVDRPAVVATADVVAARPSRTRRTLRLFGVTRCLQLRRTSD